jgi:hypothetical protein
LRSHFSELATTPCDGLSFSRSATIPAPGRDHRYEKMS